MHYTDACNTSVWLTWSYNRYPFTADANAFDQVLSKIQEGAEVPYFVRQADNPFHTTASGIARGTHTHTHVAMHQ
jgi:hypothetical protein